MEITFEFPVLGSVYLGHNVTGSGTDLPGWFGSTELCILAVTPLRGVLASC